MAKLKRNRAQCLVCFDIIESKYGWDYVRCTCGGIFIDGGLNYQRSGAVDFNKFKDLAEYEEE